MIQCPYCSKDIDLKIVVATSKQTPAESGDELGALLRSIDMSRLDNRESEFVQETKDRYAKYKSAIRMTEKQLSWLRRIAGESF